MAFVASASACRISIRACRRSSIACRASSRCARSRRRRARSGFDSVNYDLIYGLPLQTLRQRGCHHGRGLPAAARIASRCMAMRMCRGSNPGSGASSEFDLPEGDDKRRCTSWARALLAARAIARSGWITSRSRATACGRRSARGPCIAISWATRRRVHEPMIGLGVSSIGDAGDAFAQNEKDLQRYQERVAQRRAADAARSRAGCRRPGAAPAHSATDDAAGDALGSSRRDYTDASCHATASAWRSRQPMAWYELEHRRLPRHRERARRFCATSAWRSMRGSRADCRTRRCSAVRSSRLRTA